MKGIDTAKITTMDKIFLGSYGVLTLCFIFYEKVIHFFGFCVE